MGATAVEKPLLFIVSRQIDNSETRVITWCWSEESPSSYLNIRYPVIQSLNITPPLVQLNFVYLQKRYCKTDSEVAALDVHFRCLTLGVENNVCLS